jgi:ubiquinone/menaquinone biosynthesis C-methylase UbiE
MPIKASGGTALIDSSKIFARLDIRAGFKVADLGCGNLGHFVLPAAKLVGKDGVVYAVDILKTALGSIQQLVKTEGLNNVVTVWSDLEKVGATKITAASLDLAILKNVLFQGTKKEEIIAEAVRLLKTGGRLLIVDWKNIASPFGPPDKLRLSVEEAKVIAEKNGLKLSDEFDAGEYHYALVFVKA